MKNRLSPVAALTTGAAWQIAFGALERRYLKAHVPPAEAEALAQADAIALERAGRLHAFILNARETRRLRAAWRMGRALGKRTGSHRGAFAAFRSEGTVDEFAAYYAGVLDGKRDYRPSLRAVA